MVRAEHYQEAVDILEQGIKQAPFDALLYRLLGVSYLSLHKNTDASVLLRHAIQIFPQDSALLKLLRDSEGTVSLPNAR